MTSTSLRMVANCCCSMLSCRKRTRTARLQRRVTFVAVVFCLGVAAGVTAASVWSRWSAGAATSAAAPGKNNNAEYDSTVPGYSTQQLRLNTLDAMFDGQLNDPLHLSPPPSSPSPPRGSRGLYGRLADGARNAADNIHRANLLHRSNLVVVVTPTRQGSKT